MQVQQLKLRVIFLVLLVWLIPQVVFCKIKFPAVIASGMVLQQQADVKLWGWADAGQKVDVTSSWGVSASALSDAKGRWEVSVKTPVAGGPFSLAVLAGNEKIVLDDVLVGEVWFCSGQSNMEFPVGKTAKYWHVGVPNCEQEVASANFPNIRLFTVTQNTAVVPLDTLKGQWLVCNPQNTNNFSAVAYYYGRMLHQKLNIPIGLIHSSWGGTPAESWTRRGAIEADTSFRSILQKEAKILQNYPEAKAKYDEKLAAWKEGVANGSITGKAAQKAPSEPMGATHPKMPSVLYNAMVAPVIPYAIKGAIWYQGESNNDDTDLYGKLFPAMVKNWRNDWQLGDFPFYFVQIASHNRMKPELREAQFNTLSVLPNMGMAVTLDVGDSTDIHPVKKQPVGERLALWALAKTYGQKDLVYSGPLFKSAKAKGGKMVVAFDHIGSGLVVPKGSLTLFEVADASGNYVPAQAIVKGKNVVAWAPSVAKPLFVRYAWNCYVVPELFNHEGLPASSFRSKK